MYQKGQNGTSIKMVKPSEEPKIQPKVEEIKVSKVETKKEHAQKLEQPQLSNEKKTEVPLAEEKKSEESTE